MPEYVYISPQGRIPKRQVEPYLCLLVADKKVSGEKIVEIADWLLKTSCLYLMAWGEQSTSWNDAVDMANLKAFNFAYIQDEKFIITTWHDNETLYDVFFFAQTCATHMAVNLEKTVILHIAQQPNQEKLINLFAQVKNDIKNGNI